MQSPVARSEPVAALALFLESLSEDGRAVVSAEPLAEGADEALAVLHYLDNSARNELALSAPPFCPSAALWGARLIYPLCQFTVFRDIGVEQIQAVCGVACPEVRSPAVDWSVDLTLRHLPQVVELARHLSHADPLLGEMKEIAAAWPLSSVGITGLRDLQLDPFISHPALRRLYADRIFAAGDVSRLGDPRVDDLLRADLGVHRNLAPAIAEKLFYPPHDTH